MTGRWDEKAPGGEEAQAPAAINFVMLHNCQDISNYGFVNPFPKGGLLSIWNLGFQLFIVRLFTKKNARSHGKPRFAHKCHSERSEESRIFLDLRSFTSFRMTVKSGFAIGSRWLKILDPGPAYNTSRIRHFR